jgi:hypothetical protein
MSSGDKFAVGVIIVAIAVNIGMVSLAGYISFFA